MQAKATLYLPRLVRQHDGVIHSICHCNWSYRFLLYLRLQVGAPQAQNSATRQGNANAASVSARAYDRVCIVEVPAAVPLQLPGLERQYYCVIRASISTASGAEYSP